MHSQWLTQNLSLRLKVRMNLPDLLLSQPKHAQPVAKYEYGFFSRHLSLASPIFQCMLKRQWKEGISGGQPPRELLTSECDIEAVLVLLNIIHGRHRAVPKLVSLETLVRTAILVDYYQCHEATEVLVDRWLKALEKDFPTPYGRVITICCLSP